MTQARLHIAAAFATIGVVFAAPAMAQSSDCAYAQKFLGERQTLIKQIQGMTGQGKDGQGKKKTIDARQACSMFSKLVSNGDGGMKWISSNKDWCQVPDAFVDSFKADHGRAVEMKGKACTAAAKMAQMEKQAKEAQKNGGGGGGGGLLGGGGLTGSYKIPQGAL